MVERDRHPWASRVRRGALAGAVVVLVLGGLAFVISFAAQLPPTVVAVGTLVLVVALLATAVVARAVTRRVPRRTVLELDLDTPLRDLGGTDPLSALAARRRLTLRDAVETLERAEEDQRVVGLFARIGHPATGPADVQELRDAVVAFRASGRFAIAFAETFGEFTEANGAYQLASAFDEIRLLPTGFVGLHGPAAVVGFLRGALDKLGIDPQFDHRHEYKTAKNRITETAFTPAHREVTERLVESLADQLVEDVAVGRRLAPEEVRGLVDRAPLTAEEAHAAGLVDHLSYRDEALEAVAARAGYGARLLALDDYRRRTRRRRGRGPRVALVHGVGPVVRGRSRPTPFGLRSLASDDVAGAFRAAIDDKAVRAILFRVDSPGGSAVGSDVVWREVRRARDAGKPVVVSMGNVAGSGGYYVAMAADRIVAHPGTLTGSIGVVGGKAVLREAKAKVGLTTDEAHRGANALMWSPDHDFGDGGWSRLGVLLDDVYETFVTGVADGRGLSRERVHEIARGRVWTGADAHDIGLVDRLGGYRQAASVVRELLELEPDAPVRLVPYPRKPSPLRRLLSGDGSQPAATVLGPLSDAADAVRAVRALLGEPSDGILRAPDPPRWT